LDGNRNTSVECTSTDSSNIAALREVRKKVVVDGSSFKAEAALSNKEGSTCGQERGPLVVEAKMLQSRKLLSGKDVYSF